MFIKKITKKEALKRGFIIWQANDPGIFYARSQNKEHKDYGIVYLINK